MLQLPLLSADSESQKSNACIRELLLSEKNELLQMEGGMQHTDLRKELDQLDQLIKAWEAVEAFDQQLEAKEIRLKQIEAEIAASRLQTRCRIAPALFLLLCICFCSVR